MILNLSMIDSALPVSGIIRWLWRTLRLGDDENGTVSVFSRCLLTG